MKTGVLLMAHGTPDSLDEIEAYLRHVMTRRAPSPEFVEEIRGRYRQIGGRSPLTDITRRQAAALSKRLSLPVYVGMRHWKPYIAEAVKQAEGDGIGRLVALCMAPHEAAISVGAYHDAMRKALPATMQAVEIRSWHLEPALVELWRDRVKDAPWVLYTAHSIPVEGAGPYPAQLREMVDAIGVKGASFAWQSRSPSPIPWLEPDVERTLYSLKAQGIREVRVAPIGFVCDHIEVLYDVDILHRGHAESIGLRYSRTPMPNDDPRLIEALASAVGKALR